MATGAPQAPPASAPARRIGPFPLWVWIVGVGGVALFFYQRNKSAGGTASLQTPLVGGVATDPNTGFPVDPTTGLPYITSQPGSTNQTIDQWVRLAFQALVNAGIAPALANSALYNYAQGNDLSGDQANAINKALGLVGFPPINLPFNGVVPKPKTPVTTVYATTGLLGGSERQYTPTSGATAANLLAKYGLIFQKDGKWYTNPKKIKGPSRIFNPNVSPEVVTAFLVKIGAITPLHVAQAA